LIGRWPCEDRALMHLCPCGRLHAYMQVVPIERAGDEAWSGVAAIDRGDASTSFSKAALLVGGDAAALMIFAALGRANHGEGNAVLEVAATALPFMIGERALTGCSI
jgi:hypothetical protein